MRTPDARERLAGFLAKYEPGTAALARAALARLRARLPGAVQLVYDNYNALAIGFGPSERASEAIFSIAVFPRWVSLFFLQGARLRDPKRLLKGQGARVRHIQLEKAADLKSRDIEDLIAAALQSAAKPIHSARRGRLIVKSVSAKQRPRRPARTGGNR